MRAVKGAATVDLAAVRAALARSVAATPDSVRARRLRSLEAPLSGEDADFSAYLVFRLARRQPGIVADLARLLAAEGEAEAAAWYALDAAVLAAGDAGLQAEMAGLARDHGPADLLWGLETAVVQDPAAPPAGREAAAEHLRALRLPGRPPSTLAEALRRRLQGSAPTERDALRLGVHATAVATDDPIRALPDLRLLAGLSYWPVLAFVIEHVGPLDSARKTALRKAVVGLHARNAQLFAAAIETVPPGWVGSFDRRFTSTAPRGAEVGGLLASAIEARRAAEPRFLLISGPMRSGTTLLTNLLYSAEGERPRHPALSVAPDSVDLLRRLGLAERAGSVAAVQEGRINVQVERRQTGSSARAAALLRTALLGRIAFDAPTIAAPKVVGIKSTGLTSEYEMAREAFADTRLVIAMRDPRDIVASNNLRHFGARSRADSLTSLAQILDTLAFMDSPEAAGAYVAVYERVVRDTEGEVRRLLRFLGVDEDAYDWGSLRDGVSDNSSYRQGGKLSDSGHGVTTGSIGRWREQLSPVEAELVTALCAPGMIRLGYIEAEPKVTDALRDWGRQVIPDVLKSCAKFGSNPDRIAERARALGLVDF